MALKITITNAGRAEIINADNTGTGPVEITHIAFTETVFTPSKSMTALPDEIKRVSSIAGEVVADDTISVTAKDEGTEAYTVRGFGLITEFGTLFAVYGQEEPIIEKSAPTTLLLTNDIIFADLPTASITFGDISFSNPPASQTTPGVVTLNNAVNSTAQNQAATPAAVKTANDNANTRLAKSQNLADLISAAAARVNLGLGTSATLGNTASRTSASTTVLLQAAAMNDHRTSADHDDRYPQRANNLSDLPSAFTARANLGLGASSTMGTTASRTSTATDIVLQAKAMNDHRQSGDHDARYVKRSGDSMSGDLTLSKSNPWLTLNSSTTGGTGTDQGAGMSIGESGYKGGAAMHITYTGDGKGHIGMGVVDPVTGIPEFAAMGLYYTSKDVEFKGNVTLSDRGWLWFKADGLDDIRVNLDGASELDIYNQTQNAFATVHAKFKGDGSLLTGTASLRATGTTKTDVGLSKIPNIDATDKATANTLMTRNALGDTWARLFRSSYSSTNAIIAGIYTTQQIGSDFMRPSTPAQVMDAVGATRNIVAGSGLTGGGNLGANRTLSVDSSILRASGDRASDLRLNKYTYLNDYDEPLGSDVGLRFYVRDGVIEVGAAGGETRHPEIDLLNDRVYHQGNLADAFPRTGGTNGVQPLPNGYLFQYGYVDYVDFADERLVPITFNTTFPNQAVFAVPVINSGQASVSVTQRNFSNAGFTVVIKEFDQVIAGGRIYWFATGY